MAKKTKYLVKFLNRSAHFDADYELVDVLSIAIKNGDLHSNKSNQIFRNVSNKKHPRLHRRKNSDQSRRIAITHLKKSIYSSYLKDLHEDLSIYLADCLRGAITKGLNNKRLIGEHSFSVEVNEILGCMDWDGVLALTSTRLFRKLEAEKSTAKLISLFDRKLDLGLDQQFCDEALPFLELRHLLVHRDGKVDDEYVRKYPNMNFEVGKAPALTHDLIIRGRKCVSSLVLEIDKAIVANSLCPPDDLTN